MIQSVRKQTYTNWELCIANANPSNQEVSSILNVAGKKDNRIKVVDVPENEGIAQNTNRALEIATGEFVGLLDHDDLLEENALYEIVSCLNKDRKTDVLYTDEDKVTTDLDEYFSPNFKPDFNLDMLRANNYICHFFVAKKALIESVGKFRAEYNGAQDYDLILRCTEQAERISHVAKILYHWRVHKESTADNPLSKMYAYEAGKKAIEDHLRRCHTKGEVLQTENLGFYRVKYPVTGNPLVSILIPNKDQAETLDKCLKSIEKLTDYENYEIIIIENNSTEEKTFEYYEQICNDKIRVVYWKKEFNFALAHLKVGIPTALQFGILGLSLLIIQSVCNTFGPDVIAAFTAALRIEQMATLPMISFGVALAAYVAQNFGAGNFSRIRFGVKKASLINVILSIVMAFIMHFWGGHLVRIFVGYQNEDIVKIAHDYLFRSSLFYFFLAQIFIYRNALQGLGRAVIPMLAAVGELLMRSFAAIYLAAKIGYFGVFYAGPIAWVAASIVLAAGYYSTIKQFILKTQQKLRKNRRVS